MNVINHAIGIAIMKTKLRTGAISTSTGHSPVRIAAKTPIINVARWFRKYPII
jgi:hypothetical protein